MAATHLRLPSCPPVSLCPVSRSCCFQAPAYHRLWLGFRRENRLCQKLLRRLAAFDTTSDEGCQEVGQANSGNSLIPEKDNELSVQVDYSFDDTNTTSDGHIPNPSNQIIGGESTNIIQHIQLISTPRFGYRFEDHHFSNFIHLGFRSMLISVGFIVLLSIVNVFLPEGDDDSPEAVVEASGSPGLNLDNGSVSVDNHGQISSLHGAVDMKTGATLPNVEVTNPQIMEIRAMAREARATEQHKSTNPSDREKGDEANPKTPHSTVKVEIEKAVRMRLFGLWEKMKARAKRNPNVSGVKLNKE